jgi:hypothetical protein
MAKYLEVKEASTLILAKNNVFAGVWRPFFLEKPDKLPSVKTQKKTRRIIQYKKIRSIV